MVRLFFSRFLCIPLGGRGRKDDTHNGILPDSNLGTVGKVSTSL